MIDIENIIINTVEGRTGKNILKKK